MTPLDEARALLTEALSHLDYHREEHGCMRFDDPSLPSRVRSFLASPSTAGTRECMACGGSGKEPGPSDEDLAEVIRDAIEKPARTVTGEDFLALARSVAPLPTTVMATSIPPVAGCCDEWRTARQHRNLCPLMLANRVDVAKQRTEARTVEAIAAWLESEADAEVAGLGLVPTTEQVRILEHRGLALLARADELRAGCWRPNPESKEG